MLEFASSFFQVERIIANMSKGSKLSSQLCVKPVRPSKTPKTQKRNKIGVAPNVTPHSAQARTRTVTIRRNSSQQQSFGLTGMKRPLQPARTQPLGSVTSRKSSSSAAAAAAEAAATFADNAHGRRGSKTGRPLPQPNTRHRRHANLHPGLK